MQKAKFKIRTALIIGLFLSSMSLSAQEEFDIYQSVPSNSIALRYSRMHDNWQHRIFEVSSGERAGLLISGVGYRIDKTLQFTTAVDLIAFKNGADLRFEVMLSKKLNKGTVRPTVYAQRYLGQGWFHYGFGIAISLEQ